MTRALIPIILLIAAVGLFVVFTDPAYHGIQALQTQSGAYNDALNKSQELKATRDQLLARRNTFAPADVQKLEHVLPDNVDNIRLIIDINNIAARHGLSLKNVSAGQVSASPPSAALAVGTGGGAVGSVDVGFAVSASYDDFLAFLNDLEHSLRIVDVERIAFSAGTSSTNDYTLSIRTYWLH